MSRRQGSDDLTDELGATLFGLVLVAIVISAWLTMKATELVIRVMVAHPNNRPMWVALCTFAATALLAALAQGSSSVLNSIVLASFLGLVIVAKVVETYYQQLFLSAVNKEVLVHEVLHEPWWNA